jgi:hypothetical protein
MRDPDAEAFEFYDDPARREPAPGRPRRRPDRALTQHVPVRFSAATIDDVRRLADADGITVSAWIRRAVDDAVLRRGRGKSSSGKGVDVPHAIVQRLRHALDELESQLER